MFDGPDYASDHSNRRHQFDLKTLLLATTAVVGVSLGLLLAGWLGMLFLCLAMGRVGLMGWGLCGPDVRFLGGSHLWRTRL